MILLMAAIAGADADGDLAARRELMVTTQIAAHGVHDPRVLAAMRKVPRHLFVPDAVRDRAYEDSPLSIGDGQTISQPYIVAFMTELAQPRPEARVLEVGTGSGYQTAVLAEVAHEVYSIEIVAALAARGKETLHGLGYRNVHLRTGDGHRGWPEAAPFDAIVVTAAPEHVPQPLLDQLAPGGRLVIPVGDRFDQALEVHERTATGIERRRVAVVAFVPMTGEER